MTPDGAIATASVRLAAAGIERARSEARLLLAHVLEGGRDATLKNLILTDDEEARFQELVERRAAREPAAYIIGRREFWSLELAVGPGVLIPRPDSETLIEESLRLFPDRQARLTIGDIGTGSGALLAAALAEFPNATGLGFESSPDAYAWAKRNLATHAPDRAEVLLADWQAAPRKHFDLILCNPPYIASADIESLEPGVRLFEPRAALDGGRDGLEAYRALSELLPHLLKSCGWAILELGIGQAEAMEPIFRRLPIAHIAPDLAGIPRALVLGPTK